MRLFDEKLKNIIPVAGTDQSSEGNESDIYEEEYRVLKAKRARLILRQVLMMYSSKAVLHL